MKTKTTLVALAAASAFLLGATSCSPTQSTGDTSTAATAATKSVDLNVTGMT